MTMLFIFTLGNINISNLWVKVYGIQLDLDERIKTSFKKLIIQKDLSL